MSGKKRRDGLIYHGEYSCGRLGGGDGQILSERHSLGTRWWKRWT